MRRRQPVSLLAKSRRRGLIVYGNCQADAIALALGRDPVVTSIFDVRYCRSFNHPTEGMMTFPEDVVRRCAILCEQHDRETFPKRDLLPDDCVTVKFPSVDCNALWPFNCVNPYNAPELPVFPYGRFAYGDRVIVAAVDRGMTGSEALEYYLEGWETYKIDLDRLLKLEAARLAARDSHCDVKMADAIVERFRKERLFWTVNHPTTVLLRELIEKLLSCCGVAYPVIEDADMDATLQMHFPPAGPLGIIGVPIHPKVAEHFQLEWYDPGERYCLWDGSAYSYREYFKAMIDHAFSMKARPELLAPTQVR